MPDEPRRGGTGPGGDQAPQDDQPTGRRRRSLDDGGLSVSDLLEQHSRTDLPRPVPPPAGRRAAPEPEPDEPRGPLDGRSAESTGRRAAPEAPGGPDYFAPEDAGTRPRPATGAPPADRRRATAPPPTNEFFSPTGEGAGARTPRPHPEDTGRRRRAEERPGDFPEAPRPANGYAGGPEPRRDAGPGDIDGEASRRFPAPGRTAESTGRRARPEPPGPDAAGRRFADEPAPGRRAADEPAGPGRRFAEDLPGAGPGKRFPDGAADSSQGRRFADEPVAGGPGRRAADGGPGPGRRGEAGPDRRTEAGFDRRAADADLRAPDAGAGRRAADEIAAPGRRMADEPPNLGRRVADEPPAPGRRVADEPPGSSRRAADEPAGPGRRMADEPPGSGRRAADEPAGPGRRMADEPPRPGRRVADEQAGPGRRVADAPRRPVDGGPRQPVDPRPRPDQLDGAPGPHPAEGTGRRLADGPRPGEQHTGRRPRPPVPGEVGGPRRAAEGPEGTGRRPHPGAPRPDVPPHPGEVVPPGAIGRRLTDGPRPEDLGGPRPGPEGTGRRPRPEAPGRPGEDANGHRLPDGSGPRPRPENLEGPRRLADGPAPNDPRRLAEGPAPDGTGRRPRPDVPGRPGEDVPAGRRLPDGSGPRPRPEDLNGPRRPIDGPGPEGTGRRPVDGGGPRRPADGPAPEGTGRRPAGGPPEVPHNRPEDAPGPRRLAEGSGPRPVGDVPGRRFAEDPAEALDQGPKAAPPDRLGNSGNGNPGPAPREQIDPMSLTTEMEAISDDVKKRREVDHTLARFSAVHDELAEQERQRKERRQKLMPWKAEHDEDATEYASPVADPDDDDDRPRRRARTAKHSKIVKTIKGVALTAAVLVFVSTGVGWGAMLYIDSKFVEVDALGSNSAAVHEAEKQLGDENFLIVGSDTRAGARPEDGVGTATTEKGARSDVLMLAHVPADRKRMVVVSVPRDLRIERPECEGWDPVTGQYTGEELARESDVMANEPYAVGGPRCVAKFMTELTGLEINHFISIDFNGFKGMVDAVGAVTVCVPKPMVDDELGTIFDKAGKYDIGGGKALDYVRARKVAGEQFGDYDRVTRQQQFLSALLRKALSSEILLNPGKLNSFLNAFASATVGDNIGVNDMLTLAQSLRSLDAGRVSFVTVPHVTDEGPTLSNDDNVEVLKVEETKSLFQAIIDGTPLPKEKTDTDPPADQAKQQTSASAPAGPREGKVVDPRGVKIQVRNGDESADGAAGQATRELEALGYQVVINGNGQTTDKTIIKYNVGGEDAAATLLASVPGATLVVDPSMGGAVELLIGPGWDGVVQAPQGGATSGEPGKVTPPKDLAVVNAAADPCAG
ncbi:LCP family protein [Saccharothrix xinjiangensis]|uniref:LCP family protein n=1 Tax=Saccharothrix xinjiangensis TaxID=204798 RepID=A0ABV9Y8N6_9PSEU